MFFRVTAIAGASALIIGVGARALINATAGSISAVRKALNLPAPRTTVTVPAGAELDIPGISPLFTPNADFYRVDTALTVPSIDPDTWRLVIDGMVDQRVELTFDDLVGMGLDEYAITLTCVSNEVGGRAPRQRDVARRPDPRSPQARRTEVRCRHGALAQRRRLHRRHARSSRSPTTASTRSSPSA